MPPVVSVYSIPELLKLWARGELIAGQALGYMLQHLLDLSQRMVEPERILRELGHCRVQKKSLASLEKPDFLRTW